jgi:hypothetical protein
VSSTTTINNDADTMTTVTSGVFSVEVRVVTEIDAPADAVWRVLTATERYGEWNPFIVSFDGALTVGGGLTVVLALPDRKPQTLRPKVIQLDEGRLLAWRGHLGVPGVLDALHRLEVQELDHQHCRFVQHERFSGVLVPAVRSVLTVNTPEAFLAMNTALAQRAIFRHGA